MSSSLQMVVDRAAEDLNGLKDRCLSYAGSSDPENKEQLDQLLEALYLTIGGLNFLGRILTSERSRL